MGCLIMKLRKKKEISLRNVQYITYQQREITDSWFGNWEITSYVGFNVLRAADGLIIIKILNVCVLHADGKELFIRFTVSAFRKLPSIYVFSYFPFGFEGRMWDLIVSVPDHCLSFYFVIPSSVSFIFYSKSLYLI